MILEISVDLLFKEMDDQWSTSWHANKEIKGKNSYTGKICIDLLLFVKYLIIFRIFEKLEFIEKITFKFVVLFFYGIWVFN